MPKKKDYIINHKIISDSILIYTKDDSLQSFIEIIDASYRIIASGFCGHKAQFRGAISHGDLIDDPNGIYIGSVVEDAYINETRQVWSGCIITEKCKKYLELNDMVNERKRQYISKIEKESDIKQIKLLEEYSKIIVKYDAPMQENPKDDKLKYYQKEYYVLDWTKRVGENVVEKDSFDESDNNHAKKIKENTLLFEKWARENNR